MWQWCVNFGVYLKCCSSVGIVGWGIGNVAVVWEL